MAAIELTIGDAMTAPRWMYTDVRGGVNVALHNALHTFISSVNTSAFHLHDSLSAADESTRRALARLQHLSALSRGEIAPWKCPWPVISSARDEPLSKLPLPCATSFVTRHCTIRTQAAHDILGALRGDIADIVNDLGSRIIPPPPFDLCPFDLTHRRYNSHSQLLQRRSLILADLRRRLFATLHEGTGTINVLGGLEESRRSD